MRNWSFVCRRVGRFLRAPAFLILIPAVKVLVAIPVLNEERRLARSIGKLHQFLCQSCRFEFEVAIVDNGSTDRTRDVATGLVAAYQHVLLTQLNEKGRGRALKKVWAESDAEILSYMDVDLSTDLNCFPPLVESLLCGGFDLAIGSRLLKPSLTTRRVKRDFLSRGYNAIVRALFHTRFSDLWR